MFDFFYGLRITFVAVSCRQDLILVSICRSVCYTSYKKWLTCVPKGSSGMTWKPFVVNGAGPNRKILPPLEALS